MKGRGTKKEGDWGAGRGGGRVSEDTVMYLFNIISSNPNRAEAETLAVVRESLDAAKYLQADVDSRWVRARSWVVSGEY